jgi:hypothetical protein
MRRDRCHSCDQACPEALSTDTLARSGWRLTTITGPDGRVQAVWFCARCWQERTGSEPLRRSSRRP